MKIELRDSMGRYLAWCERGANGFLASAATALGLLLLIALTAQPRWVETSVIVYLFGLAALNIADAVERLFDAVRSRRRTPSPAPRKEITQ